MLYRAKKQKYHVFLNGDTYQLHKQMAVRKTLRAQDFDPFVSYHFPFIPKNFFCVSPRLLTGLMVEILLLLLFLVQI